MKTNNKFYEKRWFCILLLFLFAPVGIFLLWKYKYFSVTANTVLSIVFAIFFIVLLVTPNQDNTLNDNTVTDTGIIESSAPKVTAKTTAESSSQDEPRENIKNADLELVTKIKHPTLFSSTDSAHEFWGDDKGLISWKDREDKKISYPDTYSNYNGSGVDWSPLILELANDSNFAPNQTSYIWGIGIYFDNFKKPIKCNLNDALQIASAYLPHDVLANYYEYEHSIAYKAIKASKKADCYYEVVYSPNKKAKKERMKLNNHAYEYPIINIVLRKDANDVVTDLHIDLHQSICQSGRHSIAYGGDYKTVKWHYDFLKK